jgi:uncharacterized protein YbaR (Trm112 family)
MSLAAFYFPFGGKRQMSLASIHMLCCPVCQVRLNLLSTLLHEGFDYLHQHLTASVLGCKLFMMPFHRKVPITAQGAKAMLETAKYCQRVSIKKEKRATPKSWI